MSSQNSKSYVVGYKKPPQSTQFKKGQSGNSKGRPKGAQNLATITRRKLSEMHDVVESGKKKRVSKGEIVILAQVAKAAKGDVRSAEMLLKLDQRAEAQDWLHATEQPLGDDDQAILTRYVAVRAKSMKDPGDDHNF